jgi:hypothetical protein
LANGLTRAFSKEEVQMAKKNPKQNKNTHEEMLTIPGYKGNISQNHTHSC